MCLRKLFSLLKTVSSHYLLLTGSEECVLGLISNKKAAKTYFRAMFYMNLKKKRNTGLLF